MDCDGCFEKLPLQHFGVFRNHGSRLKETLNPKPCFWPRRHVNAQNQRPRLGPNLLALAVFRAISRAWKCAKCWCRQHFCVSAKCRNLLSSGSLLSLTLTVYRALLQLTTFTKYCEGQEKFVRVPKASR